MELLLLAGETRFIDHRLRQTGAIGRYMSVLRIDGRTFLTVFVNLQLRWPPETNMLLVVCHETSHRINASLLNIVQHQTVLVSRLCQAHNFQIRSYKMNLYAERNSAGLVAEASDTDPTRS